MATYQTVGEFTSGERLASADLEAVRENVDLVNAQSAYPFRNLLYNGAMQVAQRGTSAASKTTTGYYTADRWQMGCTTLGTWTQSVENDAPTGYGLRKSLKMLCTTADASPAASDTVFVQQSLEGYDVQRLAKGTASAQAMVLTFWVKSNAPGTYTILLYDNDNNRSVSKSYTISASATWERKEIAIPADTTGVLDNDENASLLVRWNLGQGSTFTSGTLQQTWGTYSDSVIAAGQTNLASATNNYWMMTGAQLEAGTVSTPVELCAYGDELLRCQRYYTTFSGYYSPFGTAVQIDGNNTLRGYAPVATAMRTTPSVTVTGTMVAMGPGAGYNCGSFTVTGVTGSTVLYNTSGSAGAPGVGHYSITTGNSGSIAFSAEL